MDILFIYFFFNIVFHFTRGYVFLTVLADLLVNFGRKRAKLSFTSFFLPSSIVSPWLCQTFVGKFHFTGAA